MEEERQPKYKTKPSPLVLAGLALSREDSRTLKKQAAVIFQQ